MIELILLERVEKLGQMGQLVKVKPGFARNYLLPQKKAMRATKENLAYFETACNECIWHLNKNALEKAIKYFNEHAERWLAVRKNAPPMQEAA